MKDKHGKDVRVGSVLYHDRVDFATTVVSKFKHDSHNNLVAVCPWSDFNGRVPNADATFTESELKGSGWCVLESKQ